MNQQSLEKNNILLRIAIVKNKLNRYLINYNPPYPDLINNIDNLLNTINNLLDNNVNLRDLNNLLNQSNKSTKFENADLLDIKNALTIVITLLQKYYQTYAQ